MSAPIELDPEVMHAFVVALLVAAGASEANARDVADHLIDASRAGLSSHGVLRVPQYLDDIAMHRIDPSAVPRVERDDATAVVLDADGCFGQVAATRAVDVARERARERATAIVVVRRAGHLGRIGAWTEALARDGLIAIGFCSTPPYTHSVAWFGSREGRLGTNPISYAFPTGGEPVVADFSTSATPEGRVRYARNQGVAVPDGVLRDASGVPTTDPNALYAQPPGALQPLGGAIFGHKGSALGLLVEMMATLLAGEMITDTTRGNNLALLAIRPPAGFVGDADELARYVRSSAPIDPARPVVLPGEPEARARASATTVTIDGPRGTRRSPTRPASASRRRSRAADPPRGRPSRGLGAPPGPVGGRSDRPGWRQNSVRNRRSPQAKRTHVTASRRWPVSSR